jgi:hypothetical protein
MNIKETVFAGVKFWTVYGTAHYAQSAYTKEQAMADYTKCFHAGTLYPPQFYDHWIPFGCTRQYGLT